jgi:hypothetical protein
MNKKDKEKKERIEQILARAKQNDYLDDSEFLKLLKNIPDNEIKKIKKIIDTISLKAESEKIVDSSDLMLKYIPKFSYEIVVPYSHFPNIIKPNEINEIIHKLSNDFFVLIKPYFTKDSISVRFPIMGNAGFKNLKRILDLNYKHIILSEEKIKGASEKLEMFISKKKGVVIDEEHSYPASGKRFEIIKFLKDSAKTGKILSDTQGRSLKETIKEIGEINRIFKKKMKTKEKLIMKVPTGGYELNHEKFNITFLD